jgi:hypothetical protein|tara:strand:- start:41 stop:784 length:744 start_codon:yes stop_codon:yes gene_type:complete
MAFPVSIAGSYGWEKKETSDQKHQLGSRMQFADGREYRYAHNGGTAIAEGLVVASEALVAHHGSDGDLAVATTAAGSQTIDVTVEGTAAAKDLYAEGYLWFNAAGTSVHEFYKIQKHDLFASGGAATVTLDDQDGLHQAVTNGTDTVGLMKSPYKDVIVASAAVAERPIGVTVNNFTADYYGWIQTSGFAVAKIDGTPALNSPLSLSSNHAGQLLVVGADTTGGIARVHSLAGIDNEYAVVMLYNLD